MGLGQVINPKNQIVSCVPLFLIVEILNRLWVEQLEQAAYSPGLQGTRAFNLDSWHLVIGVPPHPKLDQFSIETI